MIIDTSTIIPASKVKVLEALAAAKAKQAALTEKERIVVASSVSAVVAIGIYSLFSN